MNEESRTTEGFVGGRVEISERSEPESVDDRSSYPATIGERTEATSTLPPIPEGVVEAEGHRSQVTGHSPDPDPEVVPAPEGLRFLGSSLEDEIAFVAPDESLATFGEVMVQLIDAALEGDGVPFTGRALAQVFSRGDVEDDRVQFLLLLLAQDQPITGELVLLAARAQGYEDLVDGALLARDEIARAGDISVEQLSREGWQRAEGPPGQPGSEGPPGQPGSEGPSGQSEVQGPGSTGAPGAFRGDGVGRVEGPSSAVQVAP